MNDPFFTSASIVTRGTPWFCTTITSRPFGSVRPLNVALQFGPLAPIAAVGRSKKRSVISACAVSTHGKLRSTQSSTDLASRRLDPRLSALRRNEPIGPYTTFRIGGPADLFFEATTADSLANAVLAARDLDVPYFVLGLGANILVGDRGFRGLVIRNAARHHEFREHGDHCHLWTESGAVVKDLIQESVARGWSGLEHYVGIPSTVGGAIWQNLHFLSPAPDRERTMFIAEVFESLRDPVRGERATSRGFRGTWASATTTRVFHHRRDIILAATFRLARGDQGTLQRILQENLSWRGGRHPWFDWHPSAGSIFKKIEGVGAGRLVDQCGLKGFRQGDAQISHIHANIMVNLGHATAADVRELIAIARDSGRKAAGVHLEPEIGFIGEF